MSKCEQSKHLFQAAFETPVFATEQARSSVEKWGKSTMGGTIDLPPQATAIDVRDTVAASGPIGEQEAQKRFGKVGARYKALGAYLQKTVPPAQEHDAAPLIDHLQERGETLQTSEQTASTNEDFDETLGIRRLQRFKVNQQGNTPTREDVIGQFMKIYKEAQGEGPRAEAARKAVDKVFEKYLAAPERDTATVAVYSALLKQGTTNLIEQLGDFGWADLIERKFEYYGFDIQGKTLAELVNLSEEQANLDAIRTDSNADAEEIAEAELDSVRHIQNIVSCLPYDYAVKDPSRIARANSAFTNAGAYDKQALICVGYTDIATTLLNRLGIPAHAVTVPGGDSANRHAIVAFTTSDEKVYLADMQLDDINNELTQSQIKADSGTTVADVAQFLRDPQGELTFELAASGTGEHLPLMKSGQKPELRLHEDRQLIQFLENTGHTQSLLKQHEEALALTDIVIAAEPTASDGYTDKADVLVDLKRYDEALEFANKALERNPDGAYALVVRAEALRGLERHEEALSDAQAACRLDRHYSDAYNTLGNTYESLGDEEKALAAYDRAINLKGLDMQPYKSRALLLIKHGRFTEALDDLNEYHDALQRDLIDNEDRRELGDIREKMLDCHDGIAEQNQRMSELTDEECIEAAREPYTRLIEDRETLLRLGECLSEPLEKVHVADTIMPTHADSVDTIMPPDQTLSQNKSTNGPHF